MTDIVSQQHESDCQCVECILSEPHFLAQRLTDTFSTSEDDSLTLDSVIFRLGEPSKEDGTDSIYIGGIKNGAPHGDGILLTILNKYVGYDESKIDSYLKESGRSWTISKLNNYFLQAATLLHESEFPFLTLEGHWNEGKLIEGNSFLINDDTLLPAMAYSGTWKENLPDGYGKIHFDGGFYEGHMKSGKKHGSGFQKSLDGPVIEGEWFQGLFHGFMYFIREGSHTNVQEYYNGVEIGPRVQTIFENGEMKFSSLLTRVEEILVSHIRSWTDEKPKQSYISSVDFEDIVTSTTISSELFKSKNPNINVGDNILNLAPHRSERHWITEYSDYLIKDSNEEILGWIKQEMSPNTSKNKATIVFPDLSYYKGNIDENYLPNGTGSYTFTGGYSIISGEWLNGKISEGGIYSSNKILFKGKFSDGQPTIDGEYYMLDDSFEVKKRFSKRNRRANSKKEKMELKEQLILRIGRDVWDNELNFNEWEIKLLNNLSLISKSLQLESKKIKFSNLIMSDESQTLEFKSSIWATYNNSTGELIKNVEKNLLTEDSIVKTIAAFCNSDGGKLVIGVQDRPKRKVIGIEEDLPYSGKQKDIESYQNSLSELIRKATGNDTLVGTNIAIKIETYDKHKICIISVEKTWPKNWVWVSLKKHNKGNPEKGIFFVRTGPQTIHYSAESAHTYRTSKEASIK